MGKGITCVLMMFVILCLGLPASAAGDNDSDESAAGSMPGQADDGTVAMEEAGLVQGEALFGDMEVYSPCISPDGRHMMFLTPVDDVGNIWIGGVNPDSEPRQLTHSEITIRRAYWAWNSRQFYYLLDPAGDERYKFVAVDIVTGEETALSPEFAEDGRRVSAWGEGFFMTTNNDPAHPDEILLRTDELEEGRFDIWRVNLATGAREMVQTGVPEAQRWLVDNDLNVRGYLKGEEFGATSIWLRDGAEGEFNERLRFAADDFVSYTKIKFSDDNNSIYVLDATGRDTKALVRYDLATLEPEVIASDDEADAQDFEFHPRRHVPLAAFFYKERVVRKVLDDEYTAYLAAARARPEEDAFIAPAYGTGLTNAYYSSPTTQVDIVLLDTNKGISYPIGGDYEVPPEVQYRPLEPIQYTARDGLTIHGYLTVPEDFTQPGPLVLLVHGGPDARDYWYFNEEVQRIAGWGYACLQVNFRGSSGYGKAFRAAGDDGWGAAMQDDLSDAVAWAVAEGIADPDRVAIMGLSYGGFAVLAGLTLTPELYAAGVALNPVSDLEDNIRNWDRVRGDWRDFNDRRYGWMPRYADGERAGEIKDEADFDDADWVRIEELRSRSPLHNVDRIQAPLLLCHGGADPRVPEAGSAKFAQACRDAGVDIEYVVFEGEGHWIRRQESYDDYYARARELLARTIGGE